MRTLTVGAEPARAALAPARRNLEPARATVGPEAFWPAAMAPAPAPANIEPAASRAPAARAILDFTEPPLSSRAVWALRPEQVSWLSGLPTAPSQRPAAPVAVLRPASPMTVAGPRRTLTGFPCL